MSNLMNILKKELKELFRDKKSLSMMLIIPIMIPLLVLGLSALFESQTNKPLEEYNTIGFNYELSDIEKDIAKDLNINVVYDDDNNLKEKYEQNSIDLYVIKDETKYIINGDDNETTSYASSLMETYFSLYKEKLQTEYLEENNIDVDSVIDIITVEKILLK